MLMLERMMDMIAERTGMDRAESPAAQLHSAK